MRLQTYLMGVIGAILLLTFSTLAVLDYMEEVQQTESTARQEAREIHALLMAVRRIYHRQFIASGLPLTDQTLGFLPAHALSRIAEEFPRWTDSGIRFNNVSDRPRNPGNAADGPEREAMAWFRAHPEATERMALIEPDGEPAYYQFSKPIWLEQYCLRCHGRREEAPPTIRDRYTEAFDYQVGDLRGVMSIKLPARQMGDQALAHWSAGLWLPVAGFLVAWLLLAWVLRRTVCGPLARIQAAVQGYAAGHYDMPLPGSGYGEFGRMAGALKEMAARVEDRERALTQSRAIYRTLSETNQLVLRLERPETLYAEVCRIAVEHGGLLLAWVGLPDARRLQQVASYGAPGYLDEIRASAVDPMQAGPVADAFAKGETRVCNDLRSNPDAAPWSQAARRHGLAACAVLPLRVDEAIAGVFCVYAGEPGFFTSALTALLEEMARDIAFARANYRRETNLVSSRERLRYLAHYDPLTGLPNRDLFRERLTQALTRCRRHGHQGALLHLDLDRFKQVNTSLGHEAGNELLRQVARVLEQVQRREDTLARIGADEFLLLAEELDDSRVATVNKARLIAEKLRAAVYRGYDLAGQRVHMTLSAGVTLFPEDGDGVDRLLSYANTAMHRAKSAGGDGLRFFDPGMEVDARARMTLEHELRQALEQGQLELYYQPQWDAGGDLQTGFEALLRWRHPQRGVVEPGAFLPVLEDSGLILPAGIRILELACAQLVCWRDAGLWSDGMRLAVNLSPMQLHQADCVARARRVIEASGADPAWLELEVTEGMVSGTIQGVAEKLAELKSLGLSLALDDFGTGYSSLHRLGRLPVDTLKIDRSFVQGLPQEQVDGALVETVIAIAVKLGKGVVAEGVETASQRDFLLRRGCPIQQGYLYGRPLPPEQATEMLRGHRVA